MYITSQRALKRDKRKIYGSEGEIMAVAGRSISMFSLITDNVLEPGDEVLTFDYLVSFLLNKLPVICPQSK